MIDFKEKSPVEYWLALSSIKGLSNIQIKQLIAHFGSLKGIFEAKTSEIEQFRSLTPIITKRICTVIGNLPIFQKELDTLHAQNIQVLPLEDPNYPAQLKKIPDAPMILCKIGELTEISKKCIAIVGTREPTLEAIELTLELATILTLNGYTVVSGLALGIDTFAHMGTLQSLGKTIAVLGTDVLNVYPSKNQDLAANIQKQGCLLSEHPFRTSPSPQNLVKRNRIISGLAQATIVIEARKKSGTLHTARFAQNQGRPLFACRWEEDKGREGTRALIREGAFPFTSNEVNKVMAALLPKKQFETSKKFLVSKSNKSQGKILNPQIISKERKLMTQSDIIQNTLKDSNYRLELFTENEIQSLREEIHIDPSRGERIPFIRCPIRRRPIQLKPEEIVRQLYLKRILSRDGYNYPKSFVRVEHPVNIGSSKKFVDIAILNSSDINSIDIVVEVKKPELQEGKEQLKSYCNATGAPMAVWTNGKEISYYHRRDPNFFEEITNIPKSGQTLSDIINERFTLKNLILIDKLINDKKSLKSVILDLENEVLANAGVDVFEEVFKLIFTKLYDEYKSRADKLIINRALSRQVSAGHKLDHQIITEIVSEIDDEDFRVMEFRNTAENGTQLKSKIQNLFNDAKTQWKGVFQTHSDFELSDSHLAICVSSLQDIKLFNSNLQIIDEAFEYLVNESSKGNKGQYFTPRHVIDMCVKMLNPKKGEYMIDTASGSCGFPVHTIFKITGSLATSLDIPEEDKVHIRKIFGIDFDEKAVRVARTLNLIAGDGESNVLHLNTLDYDKWHEKTERDPDWILTYGSGFNRLKSLRVNSNNDKDFNFDILMANPPFAGDIKESRVISQYQLGYMQVANTNRQRFKTKVERDILFIERNLNFLKPGGRLAIVLPQGRFNNVSEVYIRQYILNQARLLGVVSLHVNTFKPHTSVKTSVIFLQKWNDDPSIGPLCPNDKDYPIFFASSKHSGKDTSGDYIYLKDETGQYKMDDNGHLIVKHDLHNHDGELPEGIAELFLQWANQLNFSFANEFSTNKEIHNRDLEYAIVKKSEIEKLYTMRIDADYFLPKYKSLIEGIKSKFNNSWNTLGNLVKIKDKNFIPQPNVEYKYIELANISKTGEITGCITEIGKNLPTRARRVVNTGDVIISSIEGSLDSIALITDEYNNALCSNGFYVVSPKVISSGTLLALMKSKIGQMQLKRGCNGSILTAIHKEEFLNIILPVLVNEEIESKVIESFDLRDKSKQLMEESISSLDLLF